MKSFNCRLCPRRCGARRTPDSAAPGAYCGCPSTVYIAHSRAHMWEEPPISGTKGSGTIFFSGCGLGCVYCQNRDISRPAGQPDRYNSGLADDTDAGFNDAPDTKLSYVRPAGKPYTPEELAGLLRDTEALGVHNISFVTGTHCVPDIIAALKIYRPRVPLVWNSGGYEEISVIDALAPYIDIWLPDYKYALPEPAEKYSAAPDYPDKAMAAIKRMRAHQPHDTFAGGGCRNDNCDGVGNGSRDGIMLSGVIVRHLVLPLNTRNSIAALERIAAELPGTLVSVMSQYTPVEGTQAFPELSRRITRREYDKVCDAAARLGIEGFTQRLSSAAADYIPDFL